MKVLQLASVAFCIFCAGAFARAAENTPAASTPAPASETVTPSSQKIDIPGINLIHGPTVVKLGKVAELDLPEGFAFVGPDALDKFFEMTQNTRGGNEVGVVLSPYNWNLYFDYDAIGYVKDDEKKDLDADKLYATMESGQEQANEARKSKGWSELKLRGWQSKPHYDEKTNNLKWAFKISSSRNQHQSITVNELTKYLGRGGVTEVVLVGREEGFDASQAQAAQLLSGFRYVDGQKYSEFKSGDKIAKVGLAALVVGGAGVAAAKLGWLGKFGALLAKGGKAVILGVVGLGAVIAKFWKKLIGRDKVE